MCHWWFSDKAIKERVKTTLELKPQEHKQVRVSP